MREGVADETLQRLVSLLSSLARLVAQSGQLDEEALRALLLGAELESKAMALTELQRWERLLVALWQRPTEALQHATVEALMLRGLPKPSVLLAVATITGERAAPLRPAPAPEPRLRVQPARLEWGQLTPGQEATAELDIHGGPGQVRVESDQVRVNPQHFGAEVTRVQVTVAPGADQQLWTTLRLVGVDEILEVPLLAHWAAAPPLPTTLTVAPDGSGDFSDVAVAIQHAAPGSTLRLAPGLHRLQAPLTIDKGITLVGSDVEPSRLVCAQDAYVVQYIGAGPFVARDLTFEHLGAQWAHGVIVRDGAIDFQRCCFTGGRRDAEEQHGGNGLWLLGTTSGSVTSCECIDNEQHGIAVSGQAQPSLTDNTCQANGACGIAYFTATAGIARQNACMGNALHGIQVSGHSQPHLKGNSCQGNRLSGIAYFDTATGTARENVCEGNVHYGLYVAGQAQPMLEYNTCQENRGPGLAYFGAAGGIAARNTCGNNAHYGLVVSEQAQPTLEGNSCEGNEGTGLAYFGTAAGRALENACTDNAQHGLWVGEQAQPTLEGNTCTGNRTAGLAYAGAAAGQAQQNTCADNGRHGIQVEEQSEPLLEGNICQRNASCGLAYFGTAAGIARHNTCADNAGCGMAYFGTASGMASHNACTGNALHGMQIGDHSTPTLENNSCQDNRSCGMAYVGTAAGTARQNTCSGNEHHGIQVSGQGHPVLEGNVCRGNTSCGLVYFDTATGIARQNTCTQNAHYGIQITAKADPLLQDNNRCEGNGAPGIDDQRHQAFPPQRTTRKARREKPSGQP